MDVDDLVRIRVVIPVRQCDFACGGAGLRAHPGGLHTVRLENVARARERCRVGGVLTIAALEQHHTNVIRKGSDDKKRQHPPSEEDENLTALSLVTSTLANC